MVPYAAAERAADEVFTCGLDLSGLTREGQVRKIRQLMAEQVSQFREDRVFSMEGGEEVEQVALWRRGVDLLDRALSMTPPGTRLAKSLVESGYWGMGVVGGAAQGIGAALDIRPGAMAAVVVLDPWVWGVVLGMGVLGGGAGVDRGEAAGETGVMW